MGSKGLIQDFLLGGGKKFFWIFSDSRTDEFSNWASEASPTLGCSIDISRDIYIFIYIQVKKKAFKINAKIEDVGLNED